MQVRILQGLVVLLCAAAVVAEAAEEFASDTFDSPEQVKLVAVSSDGGATYEDLYVAQQQPPVEEYTYSMNLDIAKVISMSEAPNVCEVVPMKMEYEDSNGQRHILRYSAMGNGCSNG